MLSHELEEIILEKFMLQTIIFIPISPGMMLLGNIHTDSQKSAVSLKFFSPRGC